MKYKYGVNVTETQLKEAYITVEAHNEEEAREIAEETDWWDWDKYDPVFEITSVKHIGLAAEQDDEDEE